MTTVLKSGEQITTGGVLMAPNGRPRVVLQGDSNLVVYRSVKGPALWDTGTVGSGGNQAIMQDDGNFVLYSPQGAIWATGTEGNPGAWIQIQDDGNFVVYGPGGGALWASGSSVYPLTASTEWQVSAMHMEAQVLMTEQGQLRADIHTWCTWLLQGFTGGCTVLLADVNDNIIYSWVIWPLGVDGKWIPFKQSSREDHETSQVSTDIAAATDKIYVACSHMGKNRFDDIVNQFKDAASKAAELIALYNIMA